MRQHICYVVTAVQDNLVVEQTTLGNRDRALDELERMRTRYGCDAVWLEPYTVTFDTEVPTWPRFEPQQAKEQLEHLTEHYHHDLGPDTLWQAIAIANTAIQILEQAKEKGSTEDIP